MKRFVSVLAFVAATTFPLLAQDPATPAAHGPVIFPSGTNSADTSDANATNADSFAPAVTDSSPDHSVVMPPATTLPPANSLPPAPTTLPTAPAVMPAPSQGPSFSLPGTSGKADDIRDIRPPFFYLHSWIWLWVALGILALIALIILLWKMLKSPRVMNPKTAYDLALEKLEKARALLNEEEPEPYAVLVSETVRSYLSQRFQTPSTRRTTEEFLRQMQTDSGTPLAEYRGLLSGFLEACDLVKFAKYQPTRAELEDVQQRAVTFVTATNPSAGAVQNGSHP